ncbi:MAG: cytochrome c [Anaerolineales bacterium]|nr:cytochrome c [Anaerolineales bacterium]
MKKRFIWILPIWAITLGYSLLWTPITRAGPSQQSDDPVIQGEYLTQVAMCVFCHTPFKEEYEQLETLTFDDIRAIAFSIDELIDEERLFAGGHEIPLGPAGVVVSKNLTSDVETGLGAWTDEQIKNAIRLGISRDGHQLSPVMPYEFFNGMAETDLDAIVAYLRTLPPIRNEIPHEEEQHIVPENFTPLPIRVDIVVPEPSDLPARGEYLMSAVVGCALCHTPADPTTGEPMPDLQFAGGQPFEGPWGIVYGGNLTPHEETGIGTWSDADIERILSEGIRPDGRRTVLMPWAYTSKLTPEDTAAIIYFLRNSLAPADYEVPTPALLEGLFEYVEVPEEGASETNTGTLIGLAALAALILAGGGILVRRRQKAEGGS